jgi:hypothetical protein
MIQNTFNFNKSKKFMTVDFRNKKNPYINILTKETGK